MTKRRGFSPKKETTQWKQLKKIPPPPWNAILDVCITNFLGLLLSPFLNTWKFRIVRVIKTYPSGAQRQECGVRVMVMGNQKCSTRGIRNSVTSIHSLGQPGSREKGFLSECCICSTASSAHANDRKTLFAPLVALTNSLSKLANNGVRSLDDA